jgi:hypothetical protein
MSDMTLANWVRLARRGRGLSCGGIERKGSSVSELEMEVSKLRGERAVENGERDFKESDGVLREGVAVKFAAIDSMRQSYPLGILCDVLSISTTGYHEWRASSLRPTASQ